MYVVVVPRSLPEANDRFLGRVIPAGTGAPEARGWLDVGEEWVLVRREQILRDQGQLPQRPQLSLLILRHPPPALPKPQLRELPGRTKESNGENDEIVKSVDVRMASR